MRKQKGQIQIILVIVGVLAIIGIIVGAQFWPKGKGEKDGGTSGQTPVAAVTEGPPILSNLAPSGKLASGTSKVTLSLTTNEPAFCRYSRVAGKEYDYMDDGFSSDDELNHSAQVSGLTNGQVYRFYVRCRDMDGNRNSEDGLIEFQVGEKAAGKIGGYTSAPVPEAPPVRSNLKPSGSLPSGTKETKISLTTNEPAFCRYSRVAGKEYDYMDDGFSSDKDETGHSATIRGLSDNTVYEFYVRCRDKDGNRNNEDAVIRFGVGGVSLPSGSSASDTMPPGRFGASPTTELPVETRAATVSLKTDEKAVCRYSTNSGASYESMNNIFSNTNSTTHSTEVTGLSENSSYKYYVKCADSAGNKNTNDLVISFSVAAPVDNTPPIVRNPSHSGDVLFYTTVSTVISVSTNEQANCRYSTNPGVSYGSMSGSFSHYDQTKIFHTREITGLLGGRSYSFYVKCSDMAGNANIGDAMISFSIAD